MRSITIFLVSLGLVGLAYYFSVLPQGSTPIAATPRERISYTLLGSVNGTHVYAVTDSLGIKTYYTTDKPINKEKVANAVTELSFLARIPTYGDIWKIVDPSGDGLRTYYFITPIDAKFNGLSSNAVAKLSDTLYYVHDTTKSGVSDVFCVNGRVSTGHQY